MAQARTYRAVLSVALVIVIFMAGVSVGNSWAQSRQLTQPPAPDAEVDSRPTGREQIAQMFELRLRDGLNVTEEQWATLQPQVEAVRSMAREQRRGRFMFGLREGYGERQSPDRSEGDLSLWQVAGQELRAALDNPQATEEQIVTRAKALDEARKNAEDELARVQRQLRDALDVRQQAFLMLMGVL
jgi:hypothetical protein